MLLPFHEEAELCVQKLDHTGWGVGEVRGVPVRVAFTLPGEKVRAKIFRSFKGGCDAELLEILEPSPHRQNPACPLFRLCSGCQLQHMSYEDQLLWKGGKVREILRSELGGEVSVDPVVGSPQQMGYRAKLTPHFTRDETGISSIGFIEHGRRSRILDVEKCPLASEGMNARLAELRRDIQQGVLSYPRGATLLIREADGVVVTDGREVVTETVGDIKLRFPAGSFFQNNRFLLPALVDYVTQSALDSHARLLIDAYCGCGMFGIIAAKCFQNVIGIEVADQSLLFARENAALNHTVNIDFQMGDAEALLPGAMRQDGATSMVIDPPRKGCSPGFLETMIRAKPRRIIYVSCQPESLARDLKKLTEGGFRLLGVRPFDMFPQTMHVECVAVLERAT